MSASGYITDSTLHFCVCDTTYSARDTAECDTNVSRGSKAFTGDDDVGGRGADGAGGHCADVRGQADIVSEVTLTFRAKYGLLTA